LRGVKGPPLPLTLELWRHHRAERVNWWVVVCPLPWKLRHSRLLLHRYDLLWQGSWLPHITKGPWLHSLLQLRLHARPLLHALLLTHQGSWSREAIRRLIRPLLAREKISR